MGGKTSGQQALESSETSRVELLGAITKRTLCRGEPPPIDKGSAHDTAALKVGKRGRSDAASADDGPSSSKTVRSVQADTQTGSWRRSGQPHLRLDTSHTEEPRNISPMPPYEPRIEDQASSGLLATKRAGSMQTNTPQLEVEHEEVPEPVKTVAVCQPNRAPLTRRNLALFEKMMKRKESEKSASVSQEATTETSTKTTSTTSTGFAIKARRNGILTPRGSKPPTNLEDIRKRLASPRASVSPPEPVYKEYVNTVESSINEATMVFEVGESLLKKYDSGYKRAFNQALSGFPKNVGFNNGLPPPQPDFVDGLRMEEYYPFPIDNYISGAVLYKDNPDSLALPHIAGEWKGSGEDMIEARLQSAYDGAALVYARSQALEFVESPDPSGHAEITTFTTDGTALNFFAHYASRSDDGSLEYHQYPIRSINLVNSYQEYKDGRRVFRNAQDHAMRDSYSLRDQLKEHWKHRCCAQKYNPDVAK